MKRRIFVLFALLFLLALPTPVAAQEDPEMPHFTTATGPVIDQTGRVSPEDVARLRSAAETINAEGHTQLVVDITTDVSGSATLYANHLGEENGIGHADADDGIVLLILLDREGGDGHAPVMAVAPGNGMEGTLNDALIGRLLDEHYVPARAEGRWVDGAVAFIGAVQSILNGSAPADPPPAQQSSGISPWAWIACLVVAFVVLLIVLSIWGRGGSGSSWTGGGGGYSGGSDSSSSLFSSSDSSSSSNFGGGGSFGGGGTER